jgi:hypothetical protein
MLVGELTDGYYCRRTRVSKELGGKNRIFAPESIPILWEDMTVRSRRRAAIKRNNNRVTMRRYKERIGLVVKIG